MAYRPKKEEVSISFHYLIRNKRDENSDVQAVPFTEEEFGKLFKYLSELKGIDITDEQYNDQIRNKQLAEIRIIEKINTRTISGVYGQSYWGHSFDNSVHGKITAESLNIRPFFFYLYLSDSGKIYISSQYLGSYGGYTSLKNTIFSGLPNRHEVGSKTITAGSINYKNLVAKEVEISFVRRPKTISDMNTFGKSGAISFKKQSKDDGFEKDVASKILAHTKTDKDLKKALASLLKTQELAIMDDEDIEECKVVAQINGKSKTIYLFDDSNFASKYPIAVGLDADGHPVYDQLKTEVKKLLKDNIIARIEDV